MRFYDYRNRVYFPSLGRFLQTDPIGFEAEDINLYRYVGNSPLNLIDPFGLQYVDANLQIGFGLGITFGAIFSPNGANFYLGGGIMTSPGVSIMWSPNDASTGWSAALSGGFWVGGQGGYGFGSGWFGEVGFATPGISLTGYYTFNTSGNAQGGGGVNPPGGGGAEGGGGLGPKNRNNNNDRGDNSRRRKDRKWNDRRGCWKLVKDEVNDCVRDCEYKHTATGETKYISVSEQEQCPSNPE